MKVGDEVYYWNGGPGPDRHIGIITAIEGEEATVYDADFLFREFQMPLASLRPMNPSVRSEGGQYFGIKGIADGFHANGELLDRARAVLSRSEGP